MPGTVLAAVILAADLWAIVSILGSGEASGNKVAWVVVILLLPVLGLLLWLVAGPSPRRA
mgnify:CR=1 FL=1